METEKKNDAVGDANMWGQAIRDAETKAKVLARQRSQLLRAIRLMKKLLAEGAPWPTMD